MHRANIRGIADSTGPLALDVGVSVVAKEKWYAAGLAFECTQCGNCCSGDPGYVWLTKEEIRRIAAFLGRSDEWLPKTQLRRIGFRYSLTEKKDGDCIFLKRENGKVMCSIYPVRPNQCRTWPFWTDVLRDPDTWNAVATTCPSRPRT